MRSFLVLYPPQRNGYYGGGDGPSRGGGLDRTPSKSVPARGVGNNRSFRVDFGSVEMNDRCNNSGGGGSKNNGESNGGGGGEGNGRNARDGSDDAYIGCYAKSSPLEAVKEANSATRAATNSDADCNKMGLSATPVSASAVTPLGSAKTVTISGLSLNPVIFTCLRRS